MTSFDRVRPSLNYSIPLLSNVGYFLVNKTNYPTNIFRHFLKTNVLQSVRWITIRSSLYPQYSTFGSPRIILTLKMSKLMSFVSKSVYKMQLCPILQHVQRNYKWIDSVFMYVTDTPISIILPNTYSSVWNIATRITDFFSPKKVQFLMFGQNRCSAAAALNI